MIYNSNGVPINTIPMFGIAVVGASGEIYLEQPTTNGSPNYGPNNGTITTLLANGTPTTPAIGGLGDVRDIAVDGAGNIYVIQILPSAILIYNAIGELKNTITAGLNQPEAIAVDANGKIYVTDTNAVTGQWIISTFFANGVQTSPSIVADTVAGANIMFGGLAVDSLGNIYTTQVGSNTPTDDAVDVYNASGLLVKTITAGVSSPDGVAVDANGKIYVANSFSGSLTTYLANGTQTAPTITGLGCCFSVAVH